MTPLIFGAEKQLAVAGSSVFDRMPIGHLVAVARKIASIDRVDDLTAAVPDLARTVCPCAADAWHGRGLVCYARSSEGMGESGGRKAAHQSYGHGLGDPTKVAACEKLLDEPAGAGIPVP